MGYWLATTRLWRYMDRSGLAVPWPCDDVVDLVLGQVSAALGGQAELRGLIAGRGLGNMTLRVRCRGQELAVRVAASPDSAARLRNHQRVLADLPSRLGSNQRAIAFPEAVASGAAEGISWAAERWLKSPAVRASPPGGRLAKAGPSCGRSPPNSPPGLRPVMQAMAGPVAG